jgi:hypothetical protein
VKTLNSTDFCLYQTYATLNDEIVNTFGRGARGMFIEVFQLHDPWAPRGAKFGMASLSNETIKSILLNTHK